MHLRLLFATTFGMCFGAVALPSCAIAASPRSAISSSCVDQLSDDFTHDREAQGFDGIVTPDLIAEFRDQCRANPAIAQSADRDAGRCVSRHLWGQRQSGASLSDEQVAHINASCLQSARAVLATNAAIPAFARNHGNLFTYAKTNRFFTALAPRGSSGAPDAPPMGSYQSGSDGSYAFTAVVENLSATSLLVDLVMDRAILCREQFNGGNRSHSSNWVAFYHFDDQPVIERNERCPVSLSEFAPSTLLNWREHLLKPASAKPAPSNAVQAPVKSVAGLRQFGGHCNGFILVGREYMQPGRCPEGVSLYVPAPNERGKPRLTIKTPVREAPILVLQFDQAVQGYVNNDVITFDVSPVSGLPFSWTVYDRLQCVFVKSPSDASVAAGSRYQPTATLDCSFQGNPLRDAEKLVFAFIANATDIPAFRAAFLAAHDILNPGRPFVSPSPASTNR